MSGPRLPRPYRGALLLALTGVVFAALLARQLDGQLDGLSDAPAPVVVAPASESATDADQAAAVADPARPAKDAFKAITERPLFAPSRRPPEPKVVEQPPPAPAPEPAPKTVVQRGQFKLRGVIQDGADKIALLQDLQRGGMLQVREGERFFGWTAVAIEAGRVVLQQDDVVEELTFESGSGGTLQPPEEGADGEEAGLAPRPLASESRPS